MNLEDFRYILAIAEEGSVTKAAKKLYVTQPALSQRIRGIREVYGIDLFCFDSDGAHLTRDGLCFVKYAKQILTAEQNLRQEISDLHELKSGTLRIGASQLASSAYFQDLIAAFHQGYPNVQLKFVEAPSRRVAELLRSNTIDIGVLHSEASLHDLHSEIIFEDRLTVIPRYQSSIKEQARRERQDQKSLTLSPLVLANEPLALPEEGTRAYEIVCNIFASYGIVPNIHQWSRNYAALCCLANAGISTTIILESYLSKSQLKAPHCYLESNLVDSVPMLVAWPQDIYLSHAAQAFIKLSRQVWRERSAD